MFTTRHIAAAAAAVFASAATASHAQLLPNKPIRIVTSGVGGGTDFTARQVAGGLTANLGQQVVVENRGSSVVPGEIVAKAPPDGHTLLVSTGGVLWVLPFFQKVPYDPVKDFAPITVAASFPTVLVINSSVPATSVKELIALAKAKPGSLNYVRTAQGGSAHLASELFNSMAGVKIVPVPYTNTSVAITDLISGRVQLFFSAAGPVMPHVKSGKLRALGVTSPKPSVLLPDLPTVASSLPGYDMEGLYALFAPAKTPAATINQLHKEIARVVNQPDVKERFITGGMEPVGNSPAELGALRKSDMARMGKLIREAGISGKE